MKWNETHETKWFYFSVHNNSISNYFYSILVGALILLNCYKSKIQIIRTKKKRKKNGLREASANLHDRNRANEILKVIRIRWRNGFIDVNPLMYVVLLLTFCFSHSKNKKQSKTKNQKKDLNVSLTCVKRKKKRLLLKFKYLQSIHRT